MHMIVKDLIWHKKKMQTEMWNLIGKSGSCHKMDQKSVIQRLNKAGAFILIWTACKVHGVMKAEQTAEMCIIMSEPPAPLLLSKNYIVKQMLWPALDSHAQGRRIKKSRFVSTMMLFPQVVTTGEDFQDDLNDIIS